MACLIDVRAIEIEEQQISTLELHWLQLNALFAIGKSLGLVQPDPSDMEVIVLWAKLKEKYESGRPSAPA